MIEKYIDGFLATIKADGKSFHTISAYRLDLTAFAKYFEGKDIAMLRYADLRKWTNSLEQNGLAASTRARKIAAVKSFFKYLFTMEVIDKNPADGLVTPKQEKKQPVVISSDDASNLLFYARNGNGKEILWFRDYTILAVFLYTGIRREELTNIMLTDVNFSDGTILIHGKGNKQRKVFIYDNLRPILSEYVMSHRGALNSASTSRYLFPSIKSEHVSVGTVNNIINHFFDEAGIKQRGISAHVLRKRFATTVYNNTQNIALTSKLLGHSSPDVTMRYVNIDENSMRNAAATVNF